MPGGGPAATLTFLGYRTGSALALALPEPTGRLAARLAGRVLGRAMRGRRLMLSRHLRRVYGPGISEAALRRAVAGAFDSYARYWLEAFRLPRETRESLLGRLEVEGLEHIDSAMAGGKGVVIATAHLGNWDLGGAWFAASGYRPATVVEPLEPARLFEWFCSFRRTLGLEVVPAGDGARTALLHALSEGRMVGLICDRDLSRRGVDVMFFGERTTLPTGPATLALRAGVSIVPAAVYFRDPGPHLCWVRPPIDVERRGRLGDDIARITQTVAGELEVLVRRAPDQWHLLQPNWPSDFDVTSGRLAEAQREARW